MPSVYMIRQSYKNLVNTFKSYMFPTRSATFVAIQNELCSARRLPSTVASHFHICVVGFTKRSFLPRIMVATINWSRLYHYNCLKNSEKQKRVRNSRWNVSIKNALETRTLIRIYSTITTMWDRTDHSRGSLSWWCIFCRHVTTQPPKPHFLSEAKRREYTHK